MNIFEAKKAGEVMALALKIESKEEARRFLSDYSQAIVLELTKEGEDVTAVEAMELAKKNLSVMAAFYGEESLKKVTELFETGTPTLSYYTGR